LIFLDASALVKRYVREAGTDTVLRYMQADPQWAASVLARTETRVALCRRDPEGGPDSPDQRRLAEDWERFLAVPMDATCLTLAEAIGCEHRVRTADAIHLAAARRLPRAAFLSFDQRQCDAARSLGLVVVPT
jgi:uncharacterized protein